MKAVLRVLVLAMVVLGVEPSAFGQAVFAWQTELIPTLQAPGGAESVALFEQRSNRVEFTVSVDGLPGGLYELIVGGVSRGNFNVSGGSGEIAFRFPRRNGFRELNFDPRGQVVQLAVGNTLFFAGDLTDELTTVNGKLRLNPVSERDELFNVLPGDKGRARVQIKSQTNKKARLQVQVKRLAANSTADIRVNGLTIGSVETNGRGSGRVRFSTDPKNNEELLTFDPTNSTYEIFVGGQLVLEGDVGGAPIGADLEPAGLFVEDMLNLGLEPDATAELVLEEDDTRSDLTVTVSGLEIGTYDLFINGVSAGQFEVESDDPDATSGPGDGDIEFSTVPGNSGKIPLGSSPRGSLIRVVDDEGRVAFGLEIPNLS